MKIISFSLWGDNPVYTTGALKNAELARIIYPGWICRYYVGSDTPDEIIKLLRSFDHVQVVETKHGGGAALGTMWRFEAASDPLVDVMISRDCDSRLNLREKEAVDEWLSSDKAFHIMRDHPYHGTEILAGMWGCKYPILKDMKDFIKDYTKGDFWQVDQNFLREVVYGKVRENALVHDEFFENKPFPSRRKDKHFVGMAYNQDDMPLHPEHMEMIP